MKTPEEIKKGLALCVNTNPYNYQCEECPYVEEDDGCKSMMEDALAYIRQLEANDSQVKKALQDNGFQTLEELLKAYSQVKREAGHVWISVEERLPEKHRCVLVYLRWGAIATGVHNGRNWWDELTLVNNDNVTHWMPPPEPPEEA